MGFGRLAPCPACGWTANPHPPHRDTCNARLRALYWSSNQGFDCVNISIEHISTAAGRLLREAGSPDIAEESGWACAWLQACGYPGLELMFEAIDTTSPEARNPQLM